MSVQSAHNSTASSVGSLAATFGVAVSSNGLVRGFVSWDSSDLTFLTTVTDDKSNSYTIVDKVADIAQGRAAASFYKEGITNGPTVITATLDAVNFKTAPITICIAEESGIATTAAIDGHAGQQQTNPGTGTDVITSGNATTTANGDLVCSCVVSGNVTNTVHGTNFTLRESDTAVTTKIKCEDLVQSASGAIPGTWTDATNGGGDSYITLVIGFKAATSAAVNVATSSVRAGRGPGVGPSMRRMAPQTFPTPAPVDTVTPAPSSTPFRIGRAGTSGAPTRRMIPQQAPDTIPFVQDSSARQTPFRIGRGGGMGIPTRRMFPQRYADIAASATTVTGKVGAYSWSGLAAPLSVIIAATVGAYAWSGKASPLSTEVSGKVGAYTWAGKQASLSTEIRSTAGAYAWSGKTASIATSLSGHAGAYTWAGVVANLSGLAIIQESVGAYIWSGVNSALENLVPAASVGGGAGAHKYRQPAWWGNEKKRKLEKKVEAVQKLIEKKREQIDFAPDLFRMERLIEQLQELQKRLMKLLEQIDELNQMAGDMEVLEVYLVYRSLH